MYSISLVNAVVGGTLPRVPVGPLCVVTALERAGFEVEFADYQTQPLDDKANPEVFAGFINGMASRVLGISVTCTGLPTVLAAVSRLKRDDPERVVVLGGPSATDTPAAILRHFPVDVIVCGEGEVTAVELMRVLQRHGWRCGDACVADLTAVPGLALRAGDGPVLTRARPRLGGEALPLPAYGHIDLEAYGRRAIIMTARGCPYRCRFCSAHSIWGRRVTFRPVDAVIAEMAALADRVDWFELWDDTFTLDRPRVDRFLRQLRARGLDHGWSAGSRGDLLTPDLARAMAAAGCREMFLGVESGSDEVLRRLDKGCDAAVLRRAVDLAAACFPTTHTSYIWGLPFETMDQFLDTVMCIGQDLRLEGVRPQMTMLTPLPAAPISADHRDNLDFSLEYQHSVSRLPNRNLHEYPELVDMIRRYPEVFLSFYHFAHDGMADKARVVEQLIRRAALKPK